MKTLMMISIKEDGTFSLCELSEKGQEEVYTESYAKAYAEGVDHWGEWEELDLKDIVSILEKKAKKEEK